MITNFVLIKVAVRILLEQYSDFSCVYVYVYVCVCVCVCVYLLSYQFELFGIVETLFETEFTLGDDDNLYIIAAKRKKKNVSCFQ